MYTCHKSGRRETMSEERLKIQKDPRHCQWEKQALEVCVCVKSRWNIRNEIGIGLYLHKETPEGYMRNSEQCCLCGEREGWADGVAWKLFTACSVTLFDFQIQKCIISSNNEIKNRSSTYSRGQNKYNAIEQTQHPSAAVQKWIWQVRWRQAWEVHVKIRGF